EPESFYTMNLPSRGSSIFPYTTLFRSWLAHKLFEAVLDPLLAITWLELLTLSGKCVIPLAAEGTHSGHAGDVRKEQPHLALGGGTGLASTILHFDDGRDVDELLERQFLVGL